MRPGDIVIWRDPSNKSEVHTWSVKGVHLGAPGVESLIELECLSHQPGWTGEWQTHIMMFVPECLLRQCKIGRAAPEEEKTDETRS